MRVMIAAVAVLSGGAAFGQTGFVNWESPPVNPMTLTPDGARLLVVNTADNRLEIFAVQGGSLVGEGAVPVGLDPVSVRARTAAEAWVVNHVSDSISVVDLDARRVTATLPTGDEPTDVVFAGRPQRAFVSVSQLNQVRVFDPADLAAPPSIVEVAGEDPRALATDGQRVFAAIFDSGNGTTVLGESVVSSAANPYLGNPNPPPNAGSGFVPPINPALADPPPEVSQIVRKDDGGARRDVNGVDWSAAVGWDLHDHDVAVIDAGTLAVSYVSGLMTTDMNLAVAPGGDVVVIGTEAINEVRFEPNLNGRFIRVVAATFSPPAVGPSAVVDLNPHLDYSTSTVSQTLRDESLGDPRGLAWNAAGDRLYVAGMGSNNLVAFDAALARVGRVDVGQGPVAVVVNDTAAVVYVLNRFDASVSIVDATTLVENGQMAFHDPTPASIRDGRPHLYDTHETSGLGHASCATCHIDGRMDQLAWDLGDPSGKIKIFNQVCNFGLGGCENWHPMKGPMATQTLQGILDTGPLHWRADREDLAAFNGAFESLLGDDEQLTATEMTQFETFVGTLIPPPNPFRNVDATGSLKTTALGNGGTPSIGRNLFLTANLDGVECVTCHTLPSGTNGTLTSANLLQESQSMKIPQLRNMYEKTGFDQTSSSSNRGFGFIHDGSVDTIFSFLQFSGFNFAGGATGDQQRRDVEAFLLSFATDTHASVGAQATVGGSGPDQVSWRDDLLAIASASADVAVVAKGDLDGAARGFHLDGAQFQSDRLIETYTVAELDASGTPITYTLVPAGTEVRIGVDRDADGAFDRDELDACSDPADGASLPEPGGCDDPGPADVNEDGVVDVLDLVEVVLAWGACPADPEPCPADVNGDGAVDVLDLVEVVLNWG